MEGQWNAYILHSNEPEEVCPPVMEVDGRKCEEFLL